jgi:hypothetical protein
MTPDDALHDLEAHHQAEEGEARDAAAAGQRDTASIGQA